MSDMLCAIWIVAGIKLGEIACKNLSDYFELTRFVRIPWNWVSFSNQKESEIVTFLSMIKKLHVDTACEIGTGYGGTAYLLSKAIEPSATFITIDPRNGWQKELILRCLRRVRQKMHVIKGYSGDPATIGELGRILRGRKLDLLFIDGDHSYRGVKHDFQLYSGLVREGGCIAFHDIVQDYGMKFGIHTDNWTGGVPRYWREIRHQWVSSEIIMDKAQDGFGIGVIRWRSPT